MSSLRNAVKRITHKERSQPQNRSHLGILEKKKDYKLRARDYHKKQDRIKSMQNKASQRNPDEFYFQMHKSQVIKGRHVQTEESKWKEREDIVGHDAVKIMKSQDLSYVRMIRQQDYKSLQKMKNNLHFIGHLDKEDEEEGGGDGKKRKNKRKHTIFVNDQKEATSFDAAKHFDTVPEMVGRAFNRPRLSTLSKMACSSSSPHGNDDDDDSENEEEITTSKQSTQQQPPTKKQRRQQERYLKSIAKSKARSYAELELKTKRLTTLKRTEDVLLNERHCSSKGGRRRIVQGANVEEGIPAVYKWRRKRCR